MFLLEAHHYKQGVRTRENFSRFFGRSKAKINSFGFRPSQEMDRPVGVWPNDHNFQIVRRLDFLDE